MKTRRIFHSLLVPAALCIAGTPAVLCQNLPQPTRLWSSGPFRSDPAAGTKAAPAEASTSASRPANSNAAPTNSIAFAGDRVILATFTSTRTVENTTAAESVFELLSLDASTGEIKDQREITSPDHLSIFATSDAHVIVSGSTLMRLTPDLKDAGTFNNTTNGHNARSAENISPDGSKLGQATNPGFTLIDAVTLEPNTITNNPAVVTSVNNKGFLTDNQHWPSESSKDAYFVTYLDSAGTYLIYHGKCGGKPQFVTDNLIFEPGCKNPLILDAGGELVKTLPITGDVSFAGAAQNGSKFALQIGKYGDHHNLQSERFIIYSTETWKPTAEVDPDFIGDQQSWTTFSPDGSRFVVGSPQVLTLYLVP